MKPPPNIDTSLKERRAIMHQLELLQQEALTIEELEEIGAALQKSGKRALSPLMRKLWRESNSSLISRYAYLLDFFDEEGWLSQFVQIALQRHDLSGEGKAVLLAALKGHGLDVTTPPFARLLRESGTTVDVMVNGLLELGEEGFFLFMEDFLFHSREVQLEMVRELGSMPDPRILGLLEILLWFDDEEVVLETVAALGRIREPEAAFLLAGFLPHATGAHKEAIQKNLRRLSFLGIHPTSRHETYEDPPFHAACAAPLDSSGCRSLWISRWRGNHTIAWLYLQLNEHDGVKGAWGCSAAPELDTDKHLREVSDEEGLVPVPVEYVFRLVRDAISRSSTGGASLPAEFHVLRPHLFRGQDMAPLPYLPAVAVQGSGAGTVLGTESLLDDDFFAGWFLATPRVYDFAEELAAQKPARWFEDDIVARFCRELIDPDLDRIRERLLLIADLMSQAKREEQIIRLTLAAAATLPPPGKGHLHPFLRRFARESLEIAREALAEGFDLRQQLQELEDAD